MAAPVGSPLPPQAPPTPEANCCPPFKSLILSWKWGRRSQREWWAGIPEAQDPVGYSSSSRPGLPPARPPPPTLPPTPLWKRPASEGRHKLLRLDFPTSTQTSEAGATSHPSLTLVFDIHPGQSSGIPQTHPNTDLHFPQSPSPHPLTTPSDLKRVLEPSEPVSSHTVPCWGL